MKKFNLFAVLLAVISFAFIACERPEQSEMDLSDLTDTATISGALVYDAGVDTTGSVDQYVINQFKPVANRTVFVEVPYSSYNFNGGQEGSKIFETTTDAQGNFSIEIPTTSNGLRNVTIRMQEFTAYRSEYKKMEGSSPVFETDMYRYTWVKENVTLKPGSIEFMKEEDRVCQLEKVSLDELKETITLVGNIQLAYEKGFRDGIYKAAANAVVEFEAEYPEGFDGVLTAGTVTDANGNYKITLPLKSYKDGFKSLDVKVLGLAGDPYVHYSTATDKQTLSGAYVAENILSIYGVGDIIEGMEYKMKTMYLRFTPGYTNNLANGVYPSTYTNNLVGWEKYDGYTETVTISGKYLLATSTGYGLGTYTNTTGEGLFYVNYGDIRGDKFLSAPVNADGTFSFELPVSDKQEEFEITTGYDPYKEYRYIHYKNEKETIEIDGTYIPYTEVKELGSEWNDLGTLYLKFTPSSNITSDQLNDIDWNPYLAGWVVDPDKKEKVTISANLYFPTETQFGIGSYVPASSRIFTVEANGVYYAAPINEGKFQVQIPVKNSNEQFNTYLGYSEIEAVTDYVHYTSAQGEKQTLNGKYVKRTWIGENKADRKVWNELGDIYFKFEPDVNYDLQAIKWNDNLADWHKSVIKEYKEKVAVNVNFAVETAYGKGAYVAADGIIAEISDGTFTYAAPVKNGKMEFNVLKRDQYEVLTYSWNSSLKFEVENFLHYYGAEKSNTRYLKGNYVTYDVRDAEDYLKVVHLKFSPDNTLYSFDELDEMNWFANLAGWVYNPDLKVTKTVTGTLYRAIETGFRAGTFAAAANEAVTVNVNGTEFVGVTDADGNYSIDVCMAYDERPSTFYVSNDIASKEYEFDHYRRPNTQDVEQIKVEYVQAFTTYKDGIDAWYNRKATYYKVSSHSSVDYWTYNLAGWINPEYKLLHDYTKTLTIKGTAKCAVEAKDGTDWAAKWENDKYRMLRIVIEGRTYDVVANASGAYTLQVAVEEIGTITDYYVKVMPQPSMDDDAKRVNFIHYPEVDKEKSEVLVGRFVDAGVVDGSSTYPLSGTTVEIKEPSVKSIFYPNVVPTGWANYDWASKYNE